MSTHTPYTLYKSTLKNKKYDVYVPKGNKLKKVSFGDDRYEDYTIHKDIERKNKYQARHSKDNLNNPYSPGFWSWYTLWNKPDIEDAFKDAVNKAKRIVV